MQPPPIQATQLQKRYGSLQALDAISLRIEPGEITAILGQNGAGKTTFIRCALGLEQPTSGDITLFGRRPRLRTARQKIGVMLQDSDLPDLLTGRELVSLMGSYYPCPLSTDSVIEQTETNSFADELYTNLSGGQKRRIQFACAIVGKPALIFLDEPTTGLDIEARGALWEVVRNSADNGATVVLTTHYLEEADALADRVVVFGEGRVIADAAPAVLSAMIEGATIRVETSLSAESVQKLPGCIRVETQGRRFEIRSTDAPATLRALLAKDTAVSALTVSEPTLEDVFRVLTA